MQPLEEEEEEYTFYIIVNNDLNMREGKIASQVGHLTEQMAERIMKILYETPEDTDLLFDYLQYTKTGRKKIVLRGTQQDLEELMKEKDAEYVIDEGRTQIKKDSLTVVGFLPSNKNKQRFKNFKLL